MKLLLFFAFGIVALTSCTNNTNQNSGYISKNISFYDPKTILDYVNKNKISTSQAMSSINDLQKAFKSSYIGYDLKKKLIGKSGNEIFDECSANLSMNTKGLSSFELYDYVLQCLAGFKDSHINLSKMLRPTFVTSGVSESMMINNKLYITRIRPTLIKKIEEMRKLPEGSLSDKLKVGSEVMLIDGNEPQIEINKLKKYLSASTELALQNHATGALFIRTFSYPAKSDVHLTLKTADASIIQISLPWLQVVNGSNPGTLESRTLLSDRGIIKSSDLNSDEKFMRAKGVDLSLPLFKNIQNSRVYQDPDGNDALYTGVVSLKNKNYCYLQLNTFDFEPDDEFGFKIFETIEDKSYPLSLPKVLKDYLQSCDTFKASLIFDLRNNGGGNAKVAQLIYSMFEMTITKSTYSARANLSEIGNFSMISSRLNKIDNDTATLEDLLTFQSINEALDSNSPLTSWVLTKNIDLASGFFTGEVYLLTSPNCVSACESTANRFKKSERAKIIGEATNGTGFGFSSSNSGKTNFRDSLNLFEVSMPNHAFQAALVENDTDFKTKGDTKGSLLAFDKMSVLENNPTTPNVEIKYTLNDLTNDYIDYVEKLTKVIELSSASAP
ncbi:MAG: S41 family peptidase [Bdellovibrionota bacterium]